MLTEQLTSVLVATAFLSERQDIDHRSRSRILSKIDPFDFSSPSKIRDALKRAALLLEIDLPDCVRNFSRNVDANLRTVEEWLTRGVGVTAIDDLPAPLAHAHNVGPVIFTYGNADILKLPAAGILNSRKPRHTKPGDTWLELTKVMFNSARERGFILASSYGPLTYCVSTWLSRGSPTIIVCDQPLPFMQSRQKLRRFIDEYGHFFDMEMTLFLSPFPPGKIPLKRSRYAERDHLVGAVSSIIMLGEISDHGNMRSVLDVVSHRGIPVENAKDMLPQNKCKSQVLRSDELLEQKPENKSRTSRKSPCRPEARPHNPISFENLHTRSPYLIHYTRSCPGPWPGQSRAQYCESLLEAHTGASHTGFDTLIRILRERRIRASRNLIRGGEFVICFTECAPDELQNLIQWRPGLVRWNFEPYALAFSRESLLKLGARPTIYGIEEAFDDLSEDLKYLFQIQRPFGKVWTSEKEWRIKGDLCLANLDDENIVVIVSDEHEAKIVRDYCNYKVALAGFNLLGSSRIG